MTPAGHRLGRHVEGRQPAQQSASEEVCELVDGEFGLAQNRAKDAALYVGSAVVWNDQAKRRPIGMLEDVVAAGNVMDEESGPPEGADEPVGIDRRQTVHVPASATVSRSVIGSPGAS